MSAIDTVQAAIPALESGDPLTIASLLTEDFTFSGPVPQPLGKAEFLRLAQTLKAAIPDWAFHASDFQAAGDQVQFTVQITGTHTGTLAAIPGVPPVPPTGKSIQLPAERQRVTVRGQQISRYDVEPTPGGGVPGIYAQVGAPLPPRP
jgi:predicted ester cyclase